MDYVSPSNVTPTEATPRPPYVDGNPQTGQDGSIVPAALPNSIQAEILAVIEGAGLTPAGNNLSQLLQAIQVLAAGAGATSAVFAYNPIFPEITVNGGVMSIAGSNGQIIVADGQTFTHRGGVVYSTGDFTLVERTFSLVANKTYHLRWQYNAGTPVLVLKDLANATYNPAVKAETDSSFDSTFDDMLIARVVTDGNNDPTVTALKNLNRMSAAFSKTTLETQTGAAGGFSGLPQLSGSLNWARTPARAGPVTFSCEATANEESVVGMTVTKSRYRVTAQCRGYVIGLGAGGASYVSGAVSIEAVA
jgi:hypothetical protein